MKGKRLLQIAASVLLLSGLVWWVDPVEVGKAFAGADPALIALAFAMVTANRILMAVKWNLLLAARGVEIGFGRATRIYYTSTFLGLFLPPTVGADVIRAWLVTRSESKLPEVASSIVVERVLGLVSLALFGVAAAVLFPIVMRESQLDPVLLLGLALAAASVGIGALVFSFTEVCERIVMRLLAATAREGILARIARIVGQIYQSYREYRNHRGALWVFFALTLLENALPIVRAWVVAIAFGADVALVYLFAFVPLEMLLARIPLSLDGFGLREATFVVFLGFVGVAENLGFAIGLVNHVLFVVAVLPGWLFYLLDPAARQRRGPAPSQAASETAS